VIVGVVVLILLGTARLPRNEHHHPGPPMTVILLRHGRSTSNTAHTWLADPTASISTTRGASRPKGRRAHRFVASRRSAVTAAALRTYRRATGRSRWVWSR